MKMFFHFSTVLKCLDEHEARERESGEMLNVVYDLNGYRIGMYVVRASLFVLARSSQRFSGFCLLLRFSSSSTDNEAAYNFETLTAATE